ncbi:hypothetical protein GCM10027347_12470 [Larkinella harenae]
MKTRKVNFRPAALALVTMLWSTGLLSAYGQTTTGGQPAPTGQTPNPTQPPAGREVRTESASRSSTNVANQVLMQPLANLLNQLKATKRIGDPDHDYAVLLRIHDRTAAELLQQGLRSSKSPALTTALQRMMAEQEREVNELRKIAIQIRSGGPNPEFTQLIDQKLLAMELDLKNELNGRMTGDADKDFLTVLTQHQQDSIDLTEAYLPFAKDASLKTYAQQLLENRRRDQEKMRAMMKN